MSKSPEMEAVLQRLSENLAVPRDTAFLENTCVTCGIRPLPFFRDAISLKEYKISGMCQHCQDEVFSSDE